MTAGRPVNCHLPPGDRCRWCRSGEVHRHGGFLYRDGRRDPDPLATLIALGLRDPDERVVTFGDLRVIGGYRSGCGEAQR